ncbi:HAMP domain-containing sensor histidine kinase [Dyadobacter sp. CY312]|uniref:sensor histidine kinase n=1 Tax=Dyadobacter sp. CY312 TaxID=2907303 RepID=UPI001F197E06|nr:HAMP domain-containing sensor histidine kinase [Dyadobacter sp. CY312]MCE7042701.1 HAMP domain-containing histidine kinase [Dyadobacter sp. CY312]
MNKHLHRAGIIVAAAIPLFILPARISEGQLADPVNLAGSEFVIFLMSLACWYSINYFQNRRPGWPGLFLSVIGCCILSNLFYFTFNPFFQDFPFRTPQSQISISILMLASRGVLLSVILIPAAHYLRKDQQVRHQRIENERLALEKVKVENVLLERAVEERTKALRQALGSLEKTRQELEHQIYIQSRLVASITHDISGPFHYLIIVAEKINELLLRQDYETVAAYSLELRKSLQTMFGLVNNLLDFTKLPVQQKITRIEEVNIAELIRQKAELFDGFIKNNNNTLLVECDAPVTVPSNANLLGIIVHNLIDNANKHTFKGEIAVKACVTNGRAQIICENAGNPVPESVMFWINESAVLKSDSVSSYESPGTGIGLILVKEITALLGLKIWIESENHLTRISVTF